jgi:hypothetical protein
MNYRLLFLSLTVSLYGCDGGTDADAGFDAGREEIDAGMDEEDAGMDEEDAGMDDPDGGRDGGMDGGMDAGPPDAGAIGPIVVINEVAPSDAAGGGDWVELLNVGDRTADISGWYFTDNAWPGDPTHQYIFAAGTTIAPGAYFVFAEDDSLTPEEDGFTFGLSQNGDDARIYDDNDTPADLTDDVEVQRATWPAGTIAPTSWGRFPNGTGEFSTRPAQTRGAENTL